MNTNFRRCLGAGVGAGMGVSGAQLPIIPACLCCPFSASRCARLERNNDYHLMRNNLPGFRNILRLAGCPNGFWIRQRVGFGGGNCASLYDYFD